MSDINTHSIRLKDTKKGVRITVHVNAIHGIIARDEAIKWYLETKKQLEKEGIPIAHITKEPQFPEWWIKANKLDQDQNQV